MEFQTVHFAAIGAIAAAIISGYVAYKNRKQSENFTKQLENFKNQNMKEIEELKTAQQKDLAEFKNSLDILNSENAKKKEVITHIYTQLSEIIKLIEIYATSPIFLSDEKKEKLLPEATEKFYEIYKYIGVNKIFIPERLGIESIIGKLLTPFNQIINYSNQANKYITEIHEIIINDINPILSELTRKIQEELDLNKKN